MTGQTIVNDQARSTQNALIAAPWIVAAADCENKGVKIVYY